MIHCIDIEEDAEGGPVSFGQAATQAIALTFETWSRDSARHPDYSNLSYHDYLRTPHWTETRKRALLRAGRQCQKCQRQNIRLDVHHLSYQRLGREAESDLMVLCASCHAFEHGVQA